MDKVELDIRVGAWDTGRMGRLDGLRALAILGVMLHHYGVQPVFWLDWGPVAPTVFFMLSGYFITGSLARMRDKGTAAIGRFHLRRLVRLWPALLVLLAAGYLAGLPEVREGFFWHALFLTNVKVAVEGIWPGNVSHLWTLGVQQQFYLLWPLILLLPARMWGAALGVVVLLALGFRLGCLAMQTGEYFRWMMLPGSIDAFAAGGAVALLVRKHGTNLLRGAGRWFWPACALGLWAAARALRWRGGADWPVAFIDTLEVACCAICLVALIQYPRNILSRALESRAMRWLGKVSYGLFLWHITSVMALGGLLEWAGLLHGEHTLVRAGIFTAASIVLAAASWHFIEKPCATLLDAALTKWSPPVKAPGVLGIAPPPALPKWDSAGA